MVNGYGPLGVLGTIPSSLRNALTTQGSRCHNEQAGTQLCTQRGSPDRQAREAEENDCKGIEVTPLHKGRPESIPFLLVPLARYEHRWYSPQAFDLFKRRHLLITAFVNLF